MIYANNASLPSPPNSRLPPPSSLSPYVNFNPVLNWACDQNTGNVGWPARGLFHKRTTRLSLKQLQGLWCLSRNHPSWHWISSRFSQQGYFLGKCFSLGLVWGKHNSKCRNDSTCEDLGPYFDWNFKKSFLYETSLCCPGFGASPGKNGVG